MSRRTVHAKAAALPASDHPDTAVIALAAECEAAAKRADETGDALDDADDRRGALEPPVALLRTQRDQELSIFLGDGFGHVYTQDEIDLIRVLCRRLGRADVRDIGVLGVETLSRCNAILAAWTAWKRQVEEIEIGSGFADALRAYHAANDAHIELAERLAKTSAATIEGALAKARGLRSILGDDEFLESKIAEDIASLAGMDEYTAAMSLARDLMRLVEKEEAR